MKTMKKLVCGLMTLVLLLSSVPTVFADEADTKTIDQDAACSLTIWKFDYTNAKKDGVVVLPSGLQYMVIKEGTGRKPKATDSVKCHYEGFLTDGTLFDSSLQRGEPAVFGLQQVIAGWTEGLQLMQEGAKYRFFIPYKLGYGESGAGQSIPPYSALVFDVELIKVM